MSALNLEIDEAQRAAEKERRQEEWERKQAENAKRRADPEWQRWFDNFMAEQRAKQAMATPNFVPGQTFLFIHPDLPDTDKELFFGPLDGTEQWIEIEPTWTMAHIMVQAGVFPSLTQARKNGAEGEIPAGFTDIVRGKGKKRKEITILNWFEQD